MKKLGLTVVSAALVLLGLTGCNKVDIEDQNAIIVYDFNMDADTYNSAGYWKDVYNPEFTYFAVAPLAFFQHKAEVSVYDGVEYKSFTGFCPTLVFDANDYTGQDWTMYQFSSIADPKGQGYLIAHWDVRETSATELVDRSCLITCGGYNFRPLAISVTNSSYAYWVMKNGSAFSRPFDSTDYLYLEVHGVNNGKTVSSVTVPLAQNGQIVDTWQQIDLTPLGEVQAIYFTMRSSDTGEWGMNTPAYFALSSIQIMYPNFVLY